jgi:hypothetical protein
LLRSNELISKGDYMDTKIEVNYTSFIDIRDNKLVLVQRRITEGFYERPQVVDQIVGSVLDIIA